MAGPFGKPTGTRPKSRGSEHRDSLGSSASFLSRDLGLDLPGPPYFPSRDDAGYVAGALGEHRREMMQQPDGEEQVEIHIFILACFKRSQKPCFLHASVKRQKWLQHKVSTWKTVLQ